MAGVDHAGRMAAPGPGDPPGLLVQGDNLDLMAALPPNTIDLVYADPPFFTGRRRETPRGRGRSADARRPCPCGFDDCWSSRADYLAFMRARLEAIHRLLAPHGSAVVHLDHHAVFDVKPEMDRIFGRMRFINEIIWHYTGGGRSKRRFSRKHDTLLWYAKGESWTFNIDAVRVPYNPTSGYARGGIVGRTGKVYRPHPDGTPVDDVWDIPMINPLSKERCGFPTQKPERLMERIVTAMTLPGDLILDPFSGSGTTAVAAHRHGRRWVACDLSPDAIAVARDRLRKAEADATTYRFVQLDTNARLDHSR